MINDFFQLKKFPINKEMELNSNTNPLFKQGTVLPKGKGGLSKSGGGLEIGKSNHLGIKTFKSHKVWKIEDFEVEKKVVKTEGKSDSEDSVIYID